LCTSLLSYCCMQQQLHCTNSKGGIFQAPQTAACPCFVPVSMLSLLVVTCCGVRQHPMVCAAIWSDVLAWVVDR
jgi:hypothetical protein